MKIAMVSRHLPVPTGTAAGRALHALGEGLVAGGHDLDVWSWGPERPDTALPRWSHWEPLGPEPALLTRARALVRPRSDVVRARWLAPSDADVVVADDAVSYPAVDGCGTGILTVHYGVGLDGRALGDRSPRSWQDRRAERSWAARAGGVIAYSHRVAAALGPRAVMAPIACPLPSAAVEVADEPVAACVADWAWPPNAWAARLLLEAWPHVVSRLPGARLILAGRGSEALDGATSGVRGLGPVADAADVLAEAAVLAFPCPNSSGPKVKVLEAMALGLPVVTTPSGVEGVVGADGVQGAPVALSEPEPERFAAAVVALLGDPARRAEVAAAARLLVVEHHGPRPAAAHRVTAWGEALARRRS